MFKQGNYFPRDWNWRNQDVYLQGQWQNQYVPLSLMPKPMPLYSLIYLPWKLLRGRWNWTQMSEDHSVMKSNEGWEGRFPAATLKHIGGTLAFLGRHRADEIPNSLCFPVIILSSSYCFFYFQILALLFYSNSFLDKFCQTQLAKPGRINALSISTYVWWNTFLHLSKK